MGIVRFLKSALFIYECTRILVIAVYASFLGINQGGFPLVFFAAPTVLFPLMALFLWLDTPRYRVYLPLFAAGKCIGVFSLLGWFIISRQLTIPAGHFSAAVTELIILSCDLFALAAILFIIKNEDKSTEPPSDSFQGIPTVEVE